jgi:hypothetical protein
MAAAVLLALAAWVAARRMGSQRASARGAFARVERSGLGTVVVLPPQPGVRSVALIWTVLPTLLAIYVCLIIHASAAAWALFVSSAFVMAAMAACFHREVFTLFYCIDAQKTLRIARGRPVWRGPSEALSPPGRRGTLSVGHDENGCWYFHHNGREEDGVWGRLPPADAELLRSLGVSDDRSSPSDLPRWTLASWLNVLAGWTLLAALLYPVLSPLATLEPPPRPRLHGSFRADHPALGRWQLAPQRCLSGRERGFEGVLFQFPSDSDVRELRVDMERTDETALEFRFADADRAPLRIARRECERIDSTVEASVVRINGRDMDRLEGQLSIACARYGLSAEASYRGCLP